MSNARNTTYLLAPLLLLVVAFSVMLGVYELLPYKLPNPPHARIQTVTNITAVDEVAFKGYPLNVTGTVTTKTGEPVERMLVQIIINKQKNILGESCGHGFTDRNGTFKLQCTVPSKNFETGDYHIIALSFRTSDFDSSNSDPVVPVKTYTNLTLDAPDVAVIGDEVVIRGRLQEEFGEPILYTPILFEINGTRITWARTDNTGSFAIPLKAKEGDYLITAAYNGSNYVLGSSASKIIRARELIIDARVPDYVIRGGVANVGGRVLVGSYVRSNETVTILYDGDEIARVLYDREGYFNHSYRIPANSSLGVHVFSMRIARKDVSNSSRVLVKSTTNITATYPDEVKAGEILLADVTLVDDSGAPIPVKELHVSGQNVSLLTNSSGAAALHFKVPEDYRGSTVELNITFVGDKEYVQSQHPIKVKMRGSILPLLAAVFLVLAAAGYVGVRRKDAIGAVFSGSESRRSDPAKPPKASIAMRAVEIAEGFPLVWSAGEPLRIEFSAAHAGAVVRKPIKVSVGNYAVETAAGGSGVTAATLMLHENGEYTIVAKLLGGSEYGDTEEKWTLRIVDYREEVIRLYNLLLSSAGLNSADKGHLSPREVEEFLRKKYHAKPLARIVTHFEEAEYSLHQISRAVYEKVYSSLIDIGVKS